MWKMKQVYMQVAEDGSAGAAPATAGAPPQASQEPTKEAGSVLAQGGKEQPAVLEPSTNGIDWVPEKHRVLKGDGEAKELDYEATAKKLADANRAFEKRFGAGDVPPKTVDGYKLEALPDGITADDIKSDPVMHGMLKGAHELGFTNAQIDFMLNEHLSALSDTINSSREMSMEECQAALRKTWPTQAEFVTGSKNAYRAFMAFADPSDVQLMDEVGNNPVLMRVLANIGKEMQEDKPPINPGTAEALDWDQQVSKLRGSPAYIDSSHPEHKSVMQQIEGLYARRYGENKSRLGGAKSFTVM